MKLIKKIEVNYLRSLYGAVLDDVGDLSVIFGRNDSGKSNLLRALNLFFNDETEPNRYLDFDIDMSDRRKQQAREAKARQFIWIKITFRTPPNYVGSLGEEIAVKRQWNRDGEVTETVFPPLGTAGQQSRLTRFMNDIDFAYIPAIKDLNVYADLIERMYGAAAETEALRDATNAFVAAIAGQTTTLSDQLVELFGGPATLAPPTEMSKLFRNLDFAHGANGHSLLRQKGDGVKARHLPELLRFINANETRKRLYLWGFEEPENSLDLSAAEDEAKRFAAFAGRDDTQVFITSHSPAFYLAGDDGPAQVRRYFITKQELGEDEAMVPANAAALIDRVEDAEAKMEDAGLMQLPFVIRRLAEQRAALDAMEKEAEALRQELRQLHQPSLFVEGPHDVRLFQRALERLGIEGRIDVKPLGGTPQTSDALLAAVLEQGGINPNQPTLFLFDDDKAGRGAARKLTKSNLSASPSTYRDRTHVWVIRRTDDFNRFARRLGISHDQAFFTAEFLFPVEDAAALCGELIAGHPGNDALEEWAQTINGDYWPSLGARKCTSLINAAPGTADWFYSRGVPDALKQSFAEEADRRGFETANIDAIVGVVRDTLLV